VKGRQTGLTMVELLVAIVLSVVVVDAALSLLQANRSTFYTTAALSSVSDNGRVAMNFISEAVRSGGYMACNATNDRREIVAAGQTRQVNVIQAGATPVLRNYNNAFGGYEAKNSAPGSALTVAAMPVVADNTAGDWINAGGLDGLLTTAPSPGVVQGTDVLVVRESLPQSIPIYTTALYTKGGVQTTLTVNSVGNIQQGQYAVISDCTVSTVFQVGAVAGNVISTAGALDLFGGDLKWSYAEPTPITPVDMYIYFIGPGRDNDSSLWMYDELKNNFLELVPDIENMQVLYGVPTTVANQPQQYVTADQVANFDQVVGVKVALLAASQPSVAAVQNATAATVQSFSLLNTTVTPPLDARLRKVFETTIAVRNASL
jgi:type IV pilus assembly protein PilW